MDCLDLDSKLVWGILVLLYMAVSQIGKLLKSASRSGEKPEPSREPEITYEEVGLEEQKEEEAPREDAVDKFRSEWLERLAEAGRLASELASRYVHEPANRIFLHTLREYIPQQLDRARIELAESETARVEGGATRVQNAVYVLEVIAYMGGQRRDKALAPALGDADRLAESCYRPVLTFAHAQGIGITSNHPATLLGDFELAIWTSFIPTSIAPIFLPAEFFARASWWPAIAHEVGHDFYTSIGGLDADLRAELGLVSEEEGTRIIRVRQGSIAISELQRLFGVWFEEIFCDVFGTMMTGPAYVASMLDLFASPDDPQLVVTVDLRSGGEGYDPHPPRHLRFLTCCEILTKLGFGADVEKLRETWMATHAIDGEAPQELVLATDVAYLAFPMAPFLRIADTLAERLYRGPLAALGGRGMSGVAGLDYGPHRHNESKRARDALLAGKVPPVRDARAVVAGAVLASRKAPDQQEQIVQLARRAIPALGTHERAPSAYDVAMAPTEPKTARATAAGLLDSPITPSDIVQALVVGEIIGRHRAPRRY